MFKLTIRTWIIAVASIALAILVALASFGIVNQTRAPSRSLALGLYPQGWAKAAFAQNQFAAQLARAPNAKPTAKMVRLAREAVAVEPLAIAALPVIARSLSGDQLNKKAQALQLTAAELSRRNVMMNSMLIEQHLRQGDEDAAIVALGRAVSISNDTRSIYMRQLAVATARPEAGRALAPLLGRNPEWAPSYWSEVLQASSAHVEGARLRAALAGPPWNQRLPTETDFSLILKLAEIREFDLANDLAFLLGRESSSSDLLTNGAFSRNPRFAPFDWQLISTGEFGAFIEPKGRRLLISSLPNASGTVAQQLISLPAGRYRLVSTLDGEFSGEASPLRFRLRCAQSGMGGASPAPVGLGAGTTTAELAVSRSPCRWYWASLEVDTQQRSSGIDLVVRKLSLASIGRRTEGANPSPSNAVIER